MTRRTWDYPLLLTTLALVAFGLVMVFSASLAIAYDSKGGDSSFFVKKQSLWALIGLVGLFGAAAVPMRVVKRLAPYAFVLALAGLAATLAFGVELNGARRWIQVMGFSVQPSEFAKLALIAFLAGMYADRGYALTRFRALIPGLAAIGITAGLVLVGRDLGTALVIGTVGWLLLHLAGARLRHLVSVFGAAAVMAALVIWHEPYRLQRITAWLDPFADASDSGYHTVQSLIALGSGGAFGLGLGQSRQKFSYLPMPMTDSIFAVLGEELGLIGTVLVLAAFVFLLWRGIAVARNASDSFSALLAGGVTMMLAVQALVHMSVATSIVPATGLPLPFISYGGTALVAAMTGVGLLLNVARQGRSALAAAYA